MTNKHAGASRFMSGDTLAQAATVIPQLDRAGFPSLVNIRQV
jgi:hypothetical protein